MKYLDQNPAISGAESGEDATQSTELLKSRLNALNDRLRELVASTSALDRSKLEKEKALLLLTLEKDHEAWTVAFPSLEVFLNEQQWELAVETLDILFRADQEQSLAALGQAVWLSVTFPIDAELTVAMLQHIVDETPDDSDGAAVAAATASYVVDLRAQGNQHNDLQFFAMQMMGAVARRHSGIDSQEEFESWIKRLELDHPEKFIIRLRNVVDVMVQDNWWFDRDQIRAQLPVN